MNVFILGLTVLFVSSVTLGQEKPPVVPLPIEDHVHTKKVAPTKPEGGPRPNEPTEKEKAEIQREIERMAARRKKHDEEQKEAFATLNTELTYLLLEKNFDRALERMKKLKADIEKQVA